VGNFSSLWSSWNLENASLANSVVKGNASAPWEALTQGGPPVNVGFVASVASGSLNNAPVISLSVNDVSCQNRNLVLTSSTVGTSSCSVTITSTGEAWSTPLSTRSVNLFINNTGTKPFTYPYTFNLTRLSYLRPDQSHWGYNQPSFDANSGSISGLVDVGTYNALGAGSPGATIGLILASRDGHFTPTAFSVNEIACNIIPKPIFVIGGRGGSCNTACTSKGLQCDLASLKLFIGNSAAVSSAINAAGGTCTGLVPWYYDSGAGICTDPTCCGGACVGICAFGGTSAVSCSSTNSPYSRLCACTI
jgi:hypothetical protein